jgi:hypothetical protein
MYTQVGGQVSTLQFARHKDRSIRHDYSGVLEFTSRGIPSPTRRVVTKPRHEAGVFMDP